MKKALLFPGQGAQTIGTGRDFYDAFAVSRAVFEEVDDALHFKLSDLIFSGSEQELTLTQNAQPALMTVSLAAWRAFQSETGMNVSDFTFAAGHSLGQYSALCVADSLSLADTANLLRARGELMGQACTQTAGKMAALIGLDRKEVQKVVNQTQTFIANDNATQQIVISGRAENIQTACEVAVQAGAKRALPLNVAGAFHSPLMQSAADEMQDIIADAVVKDARIPVLSNVTGMPVVGGAAIKQDLICQITAQVEWTQTQHYLKENGITQALELGAGKVLAGLMKRTEPEIEVISICDVGALRGYIEKGENKNV